MSYANLAPGDLVRHPDHPEWGIGQVQSAIRQRVTVNFEHRGKHVINTDEIALVLLSDTECGA